MRGTDPPCRLSLYQWRDSGTATLLALAFLLNLAGPCFCLEPWWTALEGFTGQTGSLQVRTPVTD